MLPRKDKPELHPSDCQTMQTSSILISRPAASIYSVSPIRPMGAAGSPESKSARLFAWRHEADGSVTRLTTASQKYWTPSESAASFMEQ